MYHEITVKIEQYADLCCAWISGRARRSWLATSALDGVRVRVERCWSYLDN